MSTLTDPAARRELIARVQRLNLDAQPAWGRMNAPRMLAHCADALRMAYGDVHCTAKRVPLVRTALVKRLMLYVLPFPKNAPTARELLSRAPGEGDAEREMVVSLISRFEQEMGRAVWPEHPLFGGLDEREWGRLAYKHLDHHLTQFGA